MKVMIRIFWTFLLSSLSMGSLIPMRKTSKVVNTIQYNTKTNIIIVACKRWNNDRAENDEDRVKQEGGKASMVLQKE